jgi:uncharacterized protein YllA (UPF0747 family)
MDDGRAGRFFSRRYRDEAGLLERARKAAGQGLEKGILEAMTRYHQALGAPRESLAALEKLGRGAAVVVTGQTPGMGWGPLFTYYKAVSALKYAQGIEARGVPCVAVFWNHSDDVAGGDSVSFPGPDDRVREVSAPPAAVPGRTLYEVAAPEILSMFASSLSAALPRSGFSPWLDDLLKTAHRGSVAESFSRSLLALLGSHGLVVLEPRHLEGEAAARFFEGHLSRPERLSRAVEEGRRAVVAEGFEDHLGRDVGLNLFEVRGGRRFRVGPELDPQGRLSAGMALRPLLQDAILPTCACVGGPSEVGIMAAISPAYAAFGIDPPVILPRTTATLLEPRISRLVDGAGLKSGDLFGPDAALEARLKEGAPEGVTAARLLAHLRPDGRLQERVFTPFYYAAVVGPSLPVKFFQALDPFVFSHQLITIS